MTSAQKLVYDYALQLVGTPYRWGGANPLSGLDCSGLVQELLAVVGMDPPGDQTAQGLYDYFSNFKSQPGIGGFGALVFYGKSTKQITHVVFMLDERIAIGANGGGSNTVDAASAAKANAFVKLRPRDYRTDFVAILKPFYPKWFY